MANRLITTLILGFALGIGACGSSGNGAGAGVNKGNTSNVRTSDGKGYVQNTGVSVAKTPVLPVLPQPQPKK